MKYRKATVVFISLITQFFALLPSEIRAAEGGSWREVAAKIAASTGVTFGTISVIRLAEMVHKNPRKAAIIAAALGIPLWLLYRLYY